MHSQILFETACEYPEVRQEFLDGFDCEEATPYIDSVEYLPVDISKNFLLQGAVMMSACRSASRKRRSAIYVLPKAFEYHATVHDFASTLIDHEGTHARDSYSHPALNHGVDIPSRLSMNEMVLAWWTNFPLLAEEQTLLRARVKHICECRAYRQQLQSGRPISPEHRDTVQRQLQYSMHQRKVIDGCMERLRHELLQPLLILTESIMALQPGMQAPHTQISKFSNPSSAAITGDSSSPV